ncbi:FAD-dependent oxidoreductase [Kiritimatiellota bacterium B12222]|nr:FAD-dependent oxidoreductase [Kiritimatiellota bacterium B12222]
MSLFLTAVQAVEYIQRDICVYGDSPAALTAALQAQSQGASVALIVPVQHMGGMLVEGLGSQDVNKNGTKNEQVISGLSQEFYQRVGAKYGKSVQYRFEPHVAEAVIDEWLAEAGIDVFRNNRLVEDYRAVVKEGTRIVEVHMENGNIFRASVFIDGTIEGDLMKWAGVSYAVGRESNARYGETLNGIRGSNTYRQFSVNVDPYIVPGDPESGLIATIQDEALGTPGDGDDGVMGFCFRQTLTTTPENKISFTPPLDYDPENYEIYRRYFAAGGSIYKPVANLPGNKTDLGSWHDLSGNLYGYNKGYPDGSYADRQAIYTYHKNFIQGLYWFLSNDPAVPESVRAEWAQWGLAADEFTDNGGWPRTLYIRAGRRMISDVVITEAHTQGQQVATDSIGVAWWPPDMHHARRIVKNGYAYNEGFVFASDYVPFPIPYGAIVPKVSECSNLLVPAALSSSYVGYGSIRLEWTMMVLGQSAGAAAVEAIRADVRVQEVDYARLRVDLLAAGLVLKVPDDESEGIGPVIDNTDATQFSMSGSWQTSTYIPGYVGTNYLHDGDALKGELSATFRPEIITAGTYRLYLRWSADDRRSGAVPVTVTHAKGVSEVSLNQKEKGNQWNAIGDFEFAEGSGGSIEIKNEGTTGYVIVDALKLVQVDELIRPRLSLAVQQNELSEQAEQQGDFLVLREGSLEGDLLVNLQWEGEASLGGDVSALPLQITLGSGVDVTKIPVRVLRDELAEGDEVLGLTLLPGSGYDLNAVHQREVVLKDDPVQNWQARYFSPAEIEQGIVTAWENDPDLDQQNNLFEFIFNRNPRGADHAQLQVRIGKEMVGGQLQMFMEFPLNSDATFLSIVMEQTDELVDGWREVSGTPVTAGWDTETGVALMRYPLSLDPKCFYRLKVKLPVR